MKISYAVTVCNEARDIYSLISFLKKVKDEEDEINILVDSAHVSNQVKKVLEIFESDIVVNEREFTGNFSDHRNYHISKCRGDYIFVIDADEMPQELLIKKLKNIIAESGADTISIPRINIHPGSTQEWLDKCSFTVNEMGWINWPDYSIRILKNDSSNKYINSLHEVVSTNGKSIAVSAHPSLALWHIKSIEKQDNRWENSQYVSPGNSKNMYDSLM
jgi:glycosyltransferase involved in cell wall biosynthesis